MAVPSREFTNTVLDAVREAARAHAVDRYLAALLAPRTLRADLIALAAFAGEIERVTLLVTDAALGEIRLKWWLDWLDDLDTGSRSGNPVADVFGDVVRRRDLSRDVIRAAIDARAQELYGAPFANVEEYDEFLIRTEGALFQVASEIIGAAHEGRRAGEAMVFAETIELFGKAYGGVRQLLKLPLQVRRGRWLLPTRGNSIDATLIADPIVRARANEVRSQAISEVESTLRQARSSAGWLSGEGIVAGLPLALVAPYLNALERQDNWLASGADIVPLTRVWKLWWAHWSRSF